MAEVAVQLESNRVYIRETVCLDGSVSIRPQTQCEASGGSVPPEASAKN